MKRFLVGIIVCVMLGGAAGSARAADEKGMAPFRVATRSDHHFQLALFPQLQLVPASKEVSGLRLNLIVGSNEAVDGVDFGLINHVKETKSGIGVGLLNVSGGDAGGFFLGLVNWAGTKGIAGNFGMDGVQVGLLNRAVDTTGIQLGGVNLARTSGFTSSRSSIQIGFLNISGDLTKGGVQLGLINIAGRGGALPVMPLVNGTF